MSKNGLKYLYFLVGLANLISWQFFDGAYTTFTKPLLMPMLMLYLYERSKGQVVLQTLWIFAALVFSWLGDLALMFPEKYFLPGVGAFFVAQLLYIRLFYEYRTPVQSWSPVKAGALILYGAWLLNKLLPVAGDLSVPIAVYGLSLVTMALLATTSKQASQPAAYLQSAIGAVLFVLSDSLIAYDKFVEAIGYREISVMSTYIVAQFLIINGLIDRTKG